MVQMAGKSKKRGGCKGSTKPAKKKDVHAKKKKLAEELVTEFAGVNNLTSGLYELHCHSTCSDGHLSPDLLVSRAYRNGVRVLALTDHDTMAGVPTAMRAARKYGMRIIPGIEISAKYVHRKTGKGGVVCSATEEPVHILAYYGCCGPSNCGQLEEKLAEVREGRFWRAKEMVHKLKLLNKPIRWEDVLRLAGEGVAPGRPHVARALYEAGHVESVGEAFNKYLHNDGPAYATGAELPAADVVSLIRETGGVSVLAHPWALKDPILVIEHLKGAGLDGMEVYRSDGRHPAFGPLAETFKLVKVGGSDFHARGDRDETDLGGIDLPSMVVHEFLKVADPLWSSAVEHILKDFVQGMPEGEEEGTDFCGMGNFDVWKGDICVSKGPVLGEDGDVVCLRLSPWLCEAERQSVELMATSLGLRFTILEVDGHKAFAVYKQ